MQFIQGVKVYSGKWRGTKAIGGGGGWITPHGWQKECFRKYEYKFELELELGSTLTWVQH